MISCLISRGLYSLGKVVGNTSEPLSRVYMWHCTFLVGVRVSFMPLLGLFKLSYMVIG